MIDYQFTAKERGSNRVVQGVVQADSEQAAAKLLGQKELFVTELKEKKESSFSLKSIGFLNGIKDKDKVLFTRQLSTLVKAGLPITRALTTAVEQVNSARLKEILTSITASVEGGTSLADAFGQFPDVFNRTYVSLVSAGEQSGTLEKTLERLATQLEKDAEVRSKIRGALVYPAIVLVAIIGVVIFMLVTVLPQIKSLYVQLGVTLPILTRILLAVSNFITHYWWIVLLMVIATVVAIRTYVRSPSGRYQLDKAKMNIPLFGKLFRKVYMSRFSRTLGVLVISGVPILEGLTITADAVANDVLKKEILAVIEEVKGGKALSACLTGKEYFTTLVPQMIKIGEESGTLGDMLDRVAQYYETEVDQAVKNISVLIEPILMVFLGVIVGIIVVAVLFPVYNLAGGGLNNIGNSTAPASGSSSTGQ